MRHELTIHLTRASFAEVYKPFTSTKETREIVGRLHTCCQWKMSWKLSLMLKLKLVGKYDVFKSPILSTIIVVVIVTILIIYLDNCIPIPFCILCLMDHVGPCRSFVFSFSRSRGKLHIDIQFHTTFLSLLALSSMLDRTLQHSNNISQVCSKSVWENEY